MNLLLSLGEQHFPKFTYLGSASVPRLTSSYCIDELFILTLAHFLNLLFKSNIPSNVLTPLGMKFPLWIVDWCSLSSITKYLKFSSFVKNSKIFWSSSNTLKFMTLSGIYGLKINSIEHLLLVGTNLAASVANESTAAFCSLGIELILKEVKFVISSSTSFWYPFKCGDRQWIVFRSCLKIISESPRTLYFLPWIQWPFSSPELELHILLCY